MVKLTSIPKFRASYYRYIISLLVYTVSKSHQAPQRIVFHLHLDNHMVCMCRMRHWGSCFNPFAERDGWGEICGYVDNYARRAALTASPWRRGEKKDIIVEEARLQRVKGPKEIWRSRTWITQRTWNDRNGTTSLYFTLLNIAMQPRSKSNPCAKYSS